MKRATARPRREPGKMNKTETTYSLVLKARVRAGELAHWGFEAVKLRLADRTFYTPDFMVFLPSGLIEFHEVKGSWNAPHQEDARVKIKVAAEQHAWALFVAVTPIKVKDGGGWTREEFGPHKSCVITAPLQTTSSGTRNAPQSSGRGPEKTLGSPAR